jgi:hypothetical protein
VKCFCNARNAIPYIQYIEIINAFHDGVSDIKTVEEYSEARARLLESQDKGTSRKKEDREVNIADRGDHKDQGYYGYHGKQSL